METLPTVVDSEKITIQIYVYWYRYPKFEIKIHHTALTDASIKPEIYTNIFSVEQTL